MSQDNPAAEVSKTAGEESNDATTDYAKNMYDHLKI